MNSNDEFYAWFAGFLDGEGCFFAQVYPHPSGSMPLTVRVEITLRQDDRPTLEHIQEQMGMGQVVDRKARKPTEGAQSIWQITGKKCFTALDKLDRCKLRSKKQRDYIIWREIVEEYNLFVPGGKDARQKNQPHLTKVQKLCTELKEIRKYDRAA